MPMWGKKSEKKKGKKDEQYRARGPPEDALWVHNPQLKQQWIPESSVRRQLQAHPPPSQGRGASGYPHGFQDKGEFFYRKGELEQRREDDRLGRTPSNRSPTRSLWEYPAMQNGQPYAVNVGHPKPDPGPFRIIANQKKDYKGTVCHCGGGKPHYSMNGGCLYLAQRTPYTQDQIAQLNQQELESQQKKGNPPNENGSDDRIQ